MAPIKVFDNLYYVGPGNVSVWLIPTTDGLIVFDSTQEPLVDHVLDSIRKVGFDPKNIRYIFLTHGHLDHFGGAGKLKQAASGGADRDARRRLAADRDVLQERSVGPRRQQPERPRPRHPVHARPGDQGRRRHHRSAKRRSRSTSCRATPRARRRSRSRCLTTGGRTRRSSSADRGSATASRAAPSSSRASAG